jgi:hypothetical protein
MDLDARQTRRLFLAGTVAFPTPFPSTGVIAFVSGQLRYDEAQPRKPTPMVVIHERAQRHRSLRRMVLQKYVAALFIPGSRRSDGTFCISRKKWVNNFERGEWFLHTDVNPEEVRRRLAPDKEKPKDDKDQKENVTLRGIVFVAEHRPVMSMTEETTTAGETAECAEYGCTCERWEYGRTGEKWCTCDWY